MGVKMLAMYFENLQFLFLHFYRMLLNPSSRFMKISKYLVWFFVFFQVPKIDQGIKILELIKLLKTLLKFQIKRLIKNEKRLMPSSQKLRE